MSERDLSQARIKPGYVLDPDSIVEPVLTEADWTDFAEGVALFNRGEYWESHEAWETVWKRHTLPSRVFFQAMIQVAAAYHQLGRGIHHGVLKHFRNAATKLDPFPDVFLGVDLDPIRTALAAGIDEAVRLGPDRFDTFNQALVVKVQFERPTS